MSNKVYTVVRADFSRVPDKNIVHLRGALTRFASANFGRVMCSDDCGFFFLDLEGAKVSALQRIFEVNGATSSVRLVSSAFFDKLFNGEVVA